ncbi:unnamed protein product [Leptidea sinapis]|uniref:ABC transporter domain-containing protein n=2 Tax=Leptidea sinapis TaxID=189913 RepID=A0A5E4QPR6_9NEOP|nr:unnamed protein product [Leptidea sinapis]
MMDVKDKVNAVAWFFLLLVSYTVPPHTFTDASVQATFVARLNALCRRNRHLCPAMIPEPGMDVNKCCVLKEDPRCYFCFDEYSPAPMMLVLVVQTIVFMTLVILTEYGLFNSVIDHVSNMNYKARPPPVGDDIVAAERAYVTKAIEQPDPNKDAMLVNDLHKRYSCFRVCNAVKGISFSVKKGECFGLLGVNGAGKSTTFKMLVGEECSTRGRVYANGYFARQHYNKYLQSLGYCPQFFGLDDFLTGNDNLKLILTLRGLNNDDVRTEQQFWVEVV